MVGQGLSPAQPDRKAIPNRVLREVFLRHRHTPFVTNGVGGEQTCLDKKNPCIRIIISPAVGPFGAASLQRREFL